VSIHNPNYINETQDPSSNTPIILEPHQKIIDPTKNVSYDLYSFLTLKDLKLAKLLELDASKEPYSLHNKYFVDCISDPEDTQELEDWQICMALDKPVLIQGEIVKGK
jgi:hypothetical protein